MTEHMSGRPAGAGEPAGDNAPAPVAASAADSNQARVLEPMWEVVKRLPAYARVAAAMARDERVPSAAKAYLVAGGVYLVSPIDVIPGIIPVAGQVDDLYVVLTGLQQASRISPPAVVEAHFASAGLRPGIVDDDLAIIRRCVRQGLAWSMRKGGALIARMSRQAVSMARRAGQRGVTSDDQEPL